MNQKNNNYDIKKIQIFKFQLDKLPEDSDLSFMANMDGFLSSFLGFLGSNEKETFVLTVPRVSIEQISSTFSTSCPNNGLLTKYVHQPNCHVRKPDLLC